MAAMVASSTPPMRAAPAGVGGSDDAGFRVGKQHRGAVGGQHAERRAARCRDDGVGARPLVRLQACSAMTAVALCI